MEELKAVEAEEAKNTKQRNDTNAKQRKSAIVDRTKELNDLPAPKYTLDSKGHLIFKNIYNKGISGNYMEVFFPPPYKKSS
jgi:hypothetical protein